MIKPKSTVSVLMSVYNEEDYVAKAIVSVMTQTYKPFEFIIVDDGSTDKTADILKEAAKRYPEIKIISKDNSGLTKSLNFGLYHCTGDYIARLDGNDIALPERFKKQVEFLNNNPDYAVVGTWRIEFWEDGTPERKIRLPVTNSEIQRTLVKTSCFGHSTIMVRGNILREFRYDKKFITSQDNNLWTIIGKYYKFHNIPEYLTRILRKEGSVTLSAPKWRTLKYTMIIRFQAYKNLDCPRWYIVYMIKPLIEFIVPKKLIGMYINMKKTTVNRLIE